MKRPVIFLLLFFLLGAAACRQDDDITEAHFYIASSFTPNNDALNDSWAPKLVSGYQLNRYELNIYNQDFVHMFHSAEWNTPWDGRSPNGSIFPGGYLFTIDYSVSTDSGQTFHDHYISGTVNVML